LLGVIVPLVKGKKATTKKGIEQNTKIEIKSGKKPAQAYAISNSVARKERSKINKRK